MAATTTIESVLDEDFTITNLHHEFIRCDKKKIIHKNGWYISVIKVHCSDAMRFRFRVGIVDDKDNMSSIVHSLMYIMFKVNLDDCRLWDLQPMMDWFNSNTASGFQQTFYTLILEPYIKSQKDSFMKVLAFLDK